MKKLLVLATVSLFVFSACEMSKKFEPLGDKSASVSADPINNVMTQQPTVTEGCPPCAFNCEDTKLIVQSMFELMSGAVNNALPASTLTREVAASITQKASLSTTTTEIKTTGLSPLTYFLLSFQTIIPRACGCDESVLAPYKDILRNFVRTSAVSCMDGDVKLTAESIYNTIMSSISVDVPIILVQNLSSQIAYVACGKSFYPCSYDPIVIEPTTTTPQTVDCDSIMKKASELYDQMNRGLNGTEALLALDDLVAEGYCTCGNKYFDQTFLKSYLFKYFFMTNTDYVDKTYKICTSGTTTELLDFLSGELNLDVKSMDENLILSLFCKDYVLCPIRKI